MTNPYCPGRPRLQLFLILLLFMLTGLSMQANLRAPFQMDGYLSGALKLSGGEGGLFLVREDLRLVFPDMNIRSLRPEDTVSFTVTYEFDSRLSGEITLLVHFIALDIQSLEVALNGRPLSVTFGTEEAAKEECLQYLRIHRSSFLPDFYSRFLNRVGRTDESQKTMSLNEIFDRHNSEESKDPDFPLAGFDITLKPGRNTLVITYRQRFYVEERGHGYFKAWPEKGVTGVDYLLYPIRTWKMAENFEFMVNVEVPDFHKKKLFANSRKIPTIRSNLDLEATHDRKEHVTRLSGDFDHMPADILTLLVWVDKKVPDYLR